MLLVWRLNDASYLSWGSDAGFMRFIVSIIRGVGGSCLLWGYPSIFCPVVFMMSKSYYHLRRGHHENGCACICPILSLPTHPPPRQPPTPLFMFWIVWRWTASCLLRWMPPVSRCPVRLWQAGHRPPADDTCAFGLFLIRKHSEWWLVKRSISKTLVWLYTF